MNLFPVPPEGFLGREVFHLISDKGRSQSPIRPFLIREKQHQDFTDGIPAFANADGLPPVHRIKLPILDDSRRETMDKAEQATFALEFRLSFDFFHNIHNNLQGVKQ